ncbi:hypothetical protein ACFYZ9_34930 [Streptomyces sp. NPDC001691]|uniref:hypothetical protein n=1 Tax=Streptomyces sp. NPDC001691 TaxID=3364600 RepID=UPI003698FC31
MTSQHALIHLAPQPDATASDLANEAEDTLWDLPGGWERVLVTHPENRYAGTFSLRNGADANHPQLIRVIGGTTTRYVGGPVGLLDLHACRAQAADRAARLHDAWTHAVAAMPPVRPVADYLTAVDNSVHARIAFMDQPHVKIATSLAEARLSWADKEALAALDRDAFVERARVQAVTANSLLQLDGTWLVSPTWADTQAPETAAAEYHQRVNAYLDNLPEDHVIVGADFIR